MSQNYYGSTHTFTSKTNQTSITLTAGPDETLLVNGAFSADGLSNNRALSGFYISNPAATTFVQNVWKKLLSTTTVDTNSFKFTHTDNKLVYTGTISGIFLVSFATTFVGTTGASISIGVSKNGADPDPSAFTNVTNPTIPIANTSTTFHVSLASGDYIEIYGRNNTSTTSILPSILSLSVLGIF